MNGFFFSAVNFIEMGSVHRCCYIRCYCSNTFPNVIITNYSYWLFKFLYNALVRNSCTTLPLVCVCTVHKLLRCHHRQREDYDRPTINKMGNYSKLKENIIIHLQLFQHEVFTDKYTLSNLSKLPIKPYKLTIYHWGK